ncbi:hypothetical protein DITRI_Ditri17bG0090100 [Diplodiscus trichospermus]
MTIFRGVKTRGSRYGGGARAAVFFFWIILIFSQLRLHFALHEEASNDQSFRSPPRNARFFDTSFFHAPSSSAQFDGNEGDPHAVYGDDKRIVHTGPNPLHN